MKTEYITAAYSMTCGSAEAERRKFTKHVGRSGRIWLVADQPNCADNIYVTAYTNPEKRGEGFGGRTLTLPLVDGTTFELHGGWHSNSNAFTADVGIDITDKHRTFVVLAKKSEPLNDRSMRYKYTELCHIDPDGGAIGKFDRWKELAKQHPEAIYHHSESAGGSCSGMIRRKEDGTIY